LCLFEGRFELQINNAIFSALQILAHCQFFREIANKYSFLQLNRQANDPERNM